MSSYKIIIVNGPKEESFKRYYPMVYSDFWKSLLHGNAWFHRVDKRAFNEYYKPIIKQLIHMNCLAMAVLSADEDICLGWSLSRPFLGLLHYVFVKEPYRRTGIGTALLPKSFESITHLTEDGYAWREKKFKKIPFNPFRT